MIRDQFKDVKQVTSKESRKKNQMGERNFYAMQIPKLKEVTHAIGVSSTITFVIFALVYLLVVLLFAATRGTEEEYSLTKFVVWSCVFGALCVWMLVWFLILKPRRLARAELYRKELEKINRAQVSKAAGAYKVYGSAYEEEVRREHDELKPVVPSSAETSADGEDGSAEQTEEVPSPAPLSPEEKDGKGGEEDAGV